MVKIGATASKLPINTTASERINVINKARWGSPPGIKPWNAGDDIFSKIRRRGIILSLEIACNKRGALFLKRKQNKWINKI